MQLLEPFCFDENHQREEPNTKRNWSMYPTGSRAYAHPTKKVLELDMRLDNWKTTMTKVQMVTMILEGEQIIAST
eukprot:scaffold2830_cov131-Cylindrotheca_fusiformis.AAC.44